MSERPTPETDNNDYAYAFLEQYGYESSLQDAPVDWADFARNFERERDEAREERDQYKGLLIRLHNDLFVHHGGQAVREFKELFREENYN